MLAHCTDRQKEAIRHLKGPLLITAGPGAGKTDVIIRRAAYLVKINGVSPKNILITTFTEKATNELYDRLWTVLGRTSSDIQISTIHSFCKRLLDEYPGHHPWGRNFEVMDEGDRFLFVYSRLRELGLSAFPKWMAADFVSDVIGLFNLCTEELVDPDKFAQVARKKGGVRLETQSS